MDKLLIWLANSNIANAVEVVNGISDDEREPFWDGFIERATELNLTRPAFYSLRYASLLLDAEIPVRVLEATRRWAPPRIIVVLMDALVPRALFPQHPDRPSGMAEFSRFLLYMRSHWIRMPPWLLTYHLAYKFFATRIRRPA